jgi:hypothetical protein
MKVTSGLRRTSYGSKGIYQSRFEEHSIELVTIWTFALIPTRLPRIKIHSKCIS